MAKYRLFTKGRDQFTQLTIYSVYRYVLVKVVTGYLYGYRWYIFAFNESEFLSCFKIT